MKLFYKPGACSLASHIVLNEIGSPFELEKVDTSAGRTEGGEDYKKVNPNGYVPALRLDSGDILIEGAAILQYLADQHPDTSLAPESGSLARARLQQFLNYTASELHKAFGPFFSGRDLTDKEKNDAHDKINTKLAYIEATLSDGRPFLLGDIFTVADAYVFVVTSWTRFIGHDIGHLPHVSAYLDRIAARPSVQASLKTEGLLN